MAGGQEALELLAKEKQIYPVDNLMLVSKVLDNYPKRKEYVLEIL
jgi:hypothetical protein